MTDKLFEARLGDMAGQCDRSGAAVFSNFLDERQCAEAEQWCGQNLGGMRYMLWGGFEDAQRRIISIYPDYCEAYIREDFPIKCLTFTFRKEDRLTHRDFLGTFMGMRLKREIIGDIIISEGIAQTFVTDIAARLILSTVSKIGKVGVRVSDDRPFQIKIKQEFQEISGTVASLRLDCVVSLAARVSRENAVKLIRAEKVDVNHLTAVSVSQTVDKGDILSVRGSGRFILAGIDGETKKGRIHISLRKYI